MEKIPTESHCYLVAIVVVSAEFFIFIDQGEVSLKEKSRSEILLFYLPLANVDSILDQFHDWSALAPSTKNRSGNRVQVEESSFNGLGL